MIEQALSSLKALLDLGGPVIAVLIAMSVLALAVAVWKAVVFELEGVGRSTARGAVGATLAHSQNPRHAPNVLRARLTAQLEEDFGKLSFGLKVLELTAQIAPLLGLFGTVLGMIDAFRTLQEAGGSADPSILAGGIWVALMTTAAGLVVAIPASVLLGWFDSRLEAHDRMSRNALEDALAPNVLGQNEAKFQLSGGAPHAA